MPGRLRDGAGDQEQEEAPFLPAAGTGLLVWSAGQALHLQWAAPARYAGPVSGCGSCAAREFSPCFAGCAYGSGRPAVAACHHGAAALRAALVPAWPRPLEPKLPGGGCAATTSISGIDPYTVDVADLEKTRSPQPDHRPRSADHGHDGDTNYVVGAVVGPTMSPTTDQERQATNPPARRTLGLPTAAGRTASCLQTMAARPPRGSAGRPSDRQQARRRPGSHSTTSAVRHPSLRTSIRRCSWPDCAAALHHPAAHEP